MTISDRPDSDDASKGIISATVIIIVQTAITIVNTILSQSRAERLFLIYKKLTVHIFNETRFQ